MVCFFLILSKKFSLHYLQIQPRSPFSKDFVVILVIKPAFFSAAVLYSFRENKHPPISSRFLVIQQPFSIHSTYKAMWLFCSRFPVVQQPFPIHSTYKSMWLFYSRFIVIQLPFSIHSTYKAMWLFYNRFIALFIQHNTYSKLLLLHAAFHNHP